MIGSSFSLPDVPLIDAGSPRHGGSETLRLLAVGSDVGLAVQFEQRNAVAGFQTVVFGLGDTGSQAADPLPVVISATHIAFGQGWELRTSGLWAEQVKERAFAHWSFGLEAFALAIDEPDELVRRGHGYRVPLGWELDFIAVDDPQRADDMTESESDGSFSQRGTIEGLILTGDGQRPITGAAERFHWVDQPPSHSSLATLTNQRDSVPGSVILPTMHGPWTVEGPQP